MKTRRPRLVIDTNVVVSALLFTPLSADTPIARLRAWWQQERIAPIVSRPTVEELMAVLRYPKFQLAEEEQHEVLAAYLPHCETHRLAAALGHVPRCRDPDDQIYLDLVASAGADWLVTGDRDLLMLAGRIDATIVTPADFAKTLVLAGDK